MPEPNVTGISELVNSLNNSTNLFQDPEPNLTGLAEVISKSLVTKTKPPRKPSNDRIDFQPENSDWTLGKLPTVQDFFRQTFNKDLPISVKGQGRIHDAWRLEHTGSADIGLHPDSKEGKALINYLNKNNIPFLAFRRAIPGQSTDAHIHIGRASKYIGSAGGVGAEQEQEQEEPNIADIDKIIQAQQQEDQREFALPNSDEPNIEGIEIDPSLAVDPTSLKDFYPGTHKRLAVLAQYQKLNTPRISGKHPLEVGNILSTEIYAPEMINLKTAAGVNKVTDAWLANWNPEYAALNQQFREETKGLNIALVDSPANLKYLGNGKYRITSRPTRGVQALFEAYKKNGRKGWAATTNLINQQLDNATDEYAQEVDRKEEVIKNSPHLAAADSAVARGLLKWATTGENIKRLGQAMWVGNTEGYNSAAYLNLINAEEENRAAMLGAEESIHIPGKYGLTFPLGIPTTKGMLPLGDINTTKLVEGAAGAAFAFPEMAAAGKALPILVYLQEIHRGNRPATLGSLPMAVLVGSGGGLGKFLQAGTTISRSGIQYTEKEILEGLVKRGLSPSKVGDDLWKITTPGKVKGTDAMGQPILPTLNKVELLTTDDLFNRGLVDSDGGKAIWESAIVDRGAGNAAPFTNVPKVPGKFTREDLSILTSRLTKGESISGGQLTPLAYQLIMRGSNALAIASPELLLHPQENINEIINNIFVGLMMPVGKSPKRVHYWGDFNAAQTEVPRLVPKVPFQIGQGRIEVPITSAPIFGKRPIIESTNRDVPPVIYPSSESPNVEKYGESFNAAEFPANVESGFQARGRGQTVFLAIDDAALHLLELKRALKEGTAIKAGANPPENIARQKAIQDAIDHLERVIPEEVQKFFEEHEDVVRAAVRTNQEAINARDKYTADAKGLSATKEKLRKMGWNTIVKRADGSWLLRSGDSNAFVYSDQELINLTGMSVEAGQKLVRSPESIQPSEINPNFKFSDDPIVRAKQEEIQKMLGDRGVFNTWGTTREKQADIYKNFFSIGSNANVQPMLFGMDIILKKSAEAAYTGAFEIEDLYRRNIEPTVDLVLNRLRTSLGDAGSKLSHMHARFIFEQGMAYYNANKANPFFSPMKQEAMEKLGTRFPAKEAINVLSKYKEYEWTIGLDEFLKDKESKKERVSKNDLINMIQRSQIAIETRIFSNANVRNREKVERNTNYIREDISSMARQILREENPHDIYFDVNDFLGWRTNPMNQGIPSRLKDFELISRSDEINKLVKAYEGLREQYKELAMALTPKYSLEASSYGNLELPGATNSVEVVLKTPDIIFDESKLPTGYKFVGRVEMEAELAANPDAVFTDVDGDIHTLAYAIRGDYGYIIDENNVIRGGGYGYSKESAIKDYMKSSGVSTGSEFNAMHYQEIDNYISHYRANPRVTADGISTYFGEEFQNDRDHDAKVLYVSRLRSLADNYNISYDRSSKSRLSVLEQQLIDYAQANNKPEIPFKMQSFNKGFRQRVPVGMTHEIYDSLTNEHIAYTKSEQEAKDYIANNSTDADAAKIAVQELSARILEENIDQLKANGVGGDLGDMTTDLVYVLESLAVADPRRINKSYLDTYYPNLVKLVEDNPQLLEAQKKYAAAIAERMQFDTVASRRNYGQGINPYPFMGNAWKEVTLKQFIHDAVIAKNEDGSYKYNGVGWTTARHQMKRYNKLLEGEFITWSRKANNISVAADPSTRFSDLFSFKINDSMSDAFKDITLEDFLDLVPKHVREEIKESINNSVANAADKPYVIRKRYDDYYYATDDQGSFGYEDADILRFATEAEAQTMADSITSESHDELVVVKNNKQLGTIAISEKIGIPTEGKHKYADYDVALVNLAKSIGKRFGAKYSVKEIITTPPEVYTIVEYPTQGREPGQIDVRDSNNVTVATYKTMEEARARVAAQAKIGLEKVHFLEITPTMRASIEKEGQAFFGTGQEPPLKTSERGIRNRITSQEAWDKHKNSLIEALNKVITLFHGTNRPYRNLEAPGNWTYYTTDPAYANARISMAGDPNQNVIYRHDIQIENPLDIRELGFEDVSPNELLAKLQSHGLDVTAQDFGKNKIFVDANMTLPLSHFINQDTKARDKIRAEAIRNGYDAILTHDTIMDTSPGMDDAPPIEADTYILFDPIPGDIGSVERFSYEAREKIEANYKAEREKLIERLNDLTQEARYVVDMLRGDPTNGPLLARRRTLSAEYDALKDETAALLTREQAELHQAGNTRTVFNSGLSPEAFIDQTKLLYSAIEDFDTFSRELVRRFGEQVKPFLQDLWIQVKDLAKTATIKLDELYKNFNEEDYKKGTGGTFNFGLNPFSQPKTAAGKKYKKEKSREIDFPGIGKKLVPNAVNPYTWYSLWRGVGLAQLSTEAGEVYNTTRRGQRVKNHVETKVLFHLRDANDKVKNGLDQQVAETIWLGNERGELYNATQLAAGDALTGRPALNQAQIEAYIDIRKAIDVLLNIRLDTKLYSMRQKANRLNDRFQNATPNTPEWDTLATQLIDLSNSIDKVHDHFDQLKRSGYISTQRRGKIVGYIEDANGKLYQHFDSLKEADAWIEEQIANGANANTQQIYDVRKAERLKAVSANLTPGQFEDLIDNAGVNSRAPEIEKLRDEVYSRYPSFGYELKRDFVRGYDRNWRFVIDSVAHQTETYANSAYSRITGEEAIKKLEETGLQDSDYNLYRTLQFYIEHEISTDPTSRWIEEAFPEFAAAHPEITNFASLGGIRKATYLFQLGYDINQLYLNALAQPLSQTYSYFGRVEHQGIRLTNAEVPIYFARAGNLTRAIGQKALAEKEIRGKKPFAKLDRPGLVPIELEQILDRLRKERVIEPEFNRQLLEYEADKAVVGQLTPKNKLKRAAQLNEHWAGAFMRAGEKTTRTHAATEAWLVGKEKFGLQGEDLVDFMVRAVDATQTNPTRAEAPLAIRGKQNQGEIRKLLYQFNAFNDMWLENLALNIRADFRARGIRNTANHLAPLILMGGISGLPLAGMSSTLYTLITGEDPKKKLFDKYLGDDTFLERLVLHGVTTSSAISRKVSPGLPLVDNIKIGSTIGESLEQTLAPSNLFPAVSTGKEIAQGFDDLLEGDYLRGVAGINPILHKPIKNILTAARYNREGIRTRGNRTIVPRSQVTTKQKVLQILPGLTPTESLRYYDKQQVERIKDLRKYLKRKARKII